MPPPKREQPITVREFRSPNVEESRRGKEEGGEMEWVPCRAPHHTTPSLLFPVPFPSLSLLLSLSLSLSWLESCPRIDSIRRGCSSCEMWISTSTSMSTSVQCSAVHSVYIRHGHGAVSHVPGRGVSLSLSTFFFLAENSPR